MKKRGKDHYDAQKNGRIRDLQTCQVCGSKTGPNGHHVFDYQYGGKANIDNIVTLCSSCHRKVHNGEIDVFVF